MNALLIVIRGNYTASRKMTNVNESQQMRNHDMHVEIKKLSTTATQSSSFEKDASVQDKDYN